ncbi:MAG: FtsK/SpoIIIE domain-containing protein [Bacteroides sp.]|nr:FtsK/SpoIIIE domain-containing protein [Bacillota bacterium]MCM1393994.1 FtsK/SpoIIIE domain-containing protein [[Eubacterium] siraeum]MCM1455649.1 FtsK/SpoIIIE domain-containing protein [Bacteroides sp.]
MANTRQAKSYTGRRIAAGILLIALSAFCFLCAVGAFGGVGKAVSRFLVGFFGLAVYGYTFAGVILGIALTFGIRVRMRFTRALFYFGLLILGVMALHVYSSSVYVVDASYGSYLLDCYINTNTAGGMLLGVITFPLMRLITSVGALVIVCAVFLVLAFLGLLPSIRRNVTYTAASKKERRVKPQNSDRGENGYVTRQRVKPSQAHRIGVADAPVITDFSQIESKGDESLYVVDVEGDPMPQKRARHTKGAEGYRPINSFNPLYPNRNGGYEDETLTKPVQNTAIRADGDEYTSRGVARDILFGQEPNAEVMSRFETASNPRDALSNVSPSYDAVRRGEMRNRFSSGDSSETVREEFIRRYRENAGGEDSAYKTEAAEEGKREDISSKLDFYALIADRERTFAQNPIQLEYDEEEESEPIKKEVVKPTRVVRHADGADAINSTIRKAESAVGSNVNTGMLGALNRAIAGENAPQQQPYGELEAESYDVSQIQPQAVRPQADLQENYEASQPVRPNIVSAANSAIFESNARTAQEKTIADIEISGYTPMKESNVPYAFAGTSIDAEPVKPVQKPPKRGGYEMPKATLENTRPAYVDTNPTQGGDVPSEPLPIRQKVTGAPMSRGEIQSTTDIAKQSGRDKESAEMQSRIQNIKQAIKETPAIGQYEREALREEKIKSAQTRGVFDDDSVKKSPKKTEKVVQMHVEQVLEKPAPPPRRPYAAPPVSLLDPPKPEEDQNEDYELKKERIIRTLNFFNIKCEVKEIKVGPTFTLYKLKVEMPRGKTVSSICGYESDIAMKMEVDSVRIIAPIPGEDAVGVEVPNKIRRIVTLSEIIESPEFNKEKDPASFAVGKNLYGVSRVARVSKLPHVLIAGATGAGKSCCINSLIVSLLYKASPDDVRLILVDPKRVEMTIYAGIPHLLMDEIICDTDKAIRALNWSIQEMERRMKYFAEVGYRDIESYNADVSRHGHDKMARIIIIVDEFADLMSTGKKAVEDSVNRIARLARATGIHIVLATQRPSTDVISGTIKNNLPSRIAFKVTSNYDSRTVIDTVGAEKLLGFGDLMYLTPGSSLPERMQGAYISNDEVRRVVEFIKQHNDSYFDETVKDAIFKEEEVEEDENKTEKTRGKDKGGFSPDLLDALELGIELREDNNSPLSISYMQRKLGFGYPKAAKIHDQMKEYGFLTDDGTGKKRMIVNITREQLRLMREGDVEDGDEE